MGISTIGSLFASNIDSMSKQQSATKQDARSQSSQVSQQPQSAASTDAVVYTRSAASTTQSTAPADNARSSRVQQLKAQVESGTYRADSDKVAVAVLKELA